MLSKSCASLVAAAAVISLLAAPPTAASPVTYDYTATANGGPLNGDVFSGTFVADTGDVASGGGNVSDLTLSVLGTVVTQAEGLFGLVPVASFNADGTLASLSNFVVVSPARAAMEGLSGGIYLPSPITSLNFDGGFNYGIDPNQGENISGGTFAGAPASQTVPEASGFGLLAAAAASLGVLRRRKTETA